MKLAKLPWETFLAWLLAAFFLIGSIGNIFASEQIAADYARWGYPAWFHYLTGSLELIAAILLIPHSRRLWGAVLGVGIMAAACATVVLNKEYTHAIAPFVVLLLSLFIAWINRPNQKL